MKNSYTLTPSELPSVQAEINREVDFENELDEEPEMNRCMNDEENDEGLASLAEDAQAWEAVLQAELQESLDSPNAGSPKPKMPKEASSSKSRALRIRDMCKAWSGEAQENTKGMDEDGRDDGEEACTWDARIAEEAAVVQATGIFDGCSIEAQIDGAFLDAREEEENTTPLGRKKSGRRSAQSMQSEEEYALDQQIANEAKEKDEQV